MTIIIGVPQVDLAGGLPDVVRSLLPFIEPVALAIAGACGAGLLVQIGLDVGLRLARNALVSRI